MNNEVRPNTDTKRNIKGFAIVATSATAAGALLGGVALTEKNKELAERKDIIDGRDAEITRISEEVATLKSQLPGSEEPVEEVTPAPEEPATPPSPPQVDIDNSTNAQDTANQLYGSRPRELNTISDVEGGLDRHNLFGSFNPEDGTPYHATINNTIVDKIESLQKGERHGAAKTEVAVLFDDWAGLVEELQIAGVLSKDEEALKRILDAPFVLPQDTELTPQGQGMGWGSGQSTPSEVMNVLSRFHHGEEVGGENISVEMVRGTEVPIIRNGELELTAALLPDSSNWREVAITIEGIVKHAFEGRPEQSNEAFLELTSQIIFNRIVGERTTNIRRLSDDWRDVVVEETCLVFRKSDENIDEPFMQEDLLAREVDVRTSMEDPNLQANNTIESFYQGNGVGPGAMFFSMPDGGVGDTQFASSHDAANFLSARLRELPVMITQRDQYIPLNYTQRLINDEGNPIGLEGEILINCEEKPMPKPAVVVPELAPEPTEPKPTETPKVVITPTPKPTETPKVPPTATGNPTATPQGPEDTPTPVKETPEGTPTQPATVTPTPRATVPTPTPIIPPTATENPSATPQGPEDTPTPVKETPEGTPTQPATVTPTARPIVPTPTDNSLPPTPAGEGSSNSSIFTSSVHAAEADYIEGDRSQDLPDQTTHTPAPTIGDAFTGIAIAIVSGLTFARYRSIRVRKAFRSLFK